jgi:hypothetical protein
MKTKLMMALSLMAFAVPAFGAQAKTEPKKPGFFGKIAEAFTPAEGKKAARGPRAPKIGRVERWEITTAALRKAGHADDSAVMRWAHKNLKRAKRFSMAPRTPEEAAKRQAHKAARKKKRAERRAAMGSTKAGKRMGSKAATKAAKQPRRRRAPEVNPMATA